MRRLSNWLKKATSFSSDVIISATSKLYVGAFSISQSGTKAILDNGTGRLDIVSESEQLRLGDPDGNDGGCFLTIQNSGNLDIEFSAEGNTIIYNIPTSDPGVADALWNNSGVLNISEG